MNVPCRDVFGNDWEGVSTRGQCTAGRRRPFPEEMSTLACTGRILDMDMENTLGTMRERAIEGTVCMICELDDVDSYVFLELGLKTTWKG